MLKLNAKLQLQIGEMIYLPEKWHEKLLDTLKANEFPYEFQVISKEKRGRETVYVCRGKLPKKSKDYFLAITNDVVKYIYAEEVPDSNIGFSFKEYFPLQDTSILITSIRNFSNIQPGVLQFEVSEFETQEHGCVSCLEFQINYLNGNAFTTLAFYTSCEKATWKFLYHEDTSYMTDYEKMFQDTYVHKNYVKKSCEKLAKWLEANGATSHANRLRERAEFHDDSKIKCEDELRALSMIINDKTSLRDPNKPLSQIKMDSIKLHHKHNKHHPEHFDSFLDMSRIDMMEFVCDCHARSTQYKTDFLAIMKGRQKERFNIPDWLFEEIYHYCEVLERKE